jgi:hypothetical protein
VLVQAVHRNIERFPTDFMFQPNKAELENRRLRLAFNSRRAGCALYPC